MYKLLVILKLKIRVIQLCIYEMNFKNLFNLAKNLENENVNLFYIARFYSKICLNGYVRMIELFHGNI